MFSKESDGCRGFVRDDREESSSRDDEGDDIRDKTVVVDHEDRVPPRGVHPESRAPDGYAAPSQPSTTGTVRRRMSRSVRSEARLAYTTSSLYMSSMLSRLRPLTCQSPVSPGFTVRRGRIQSGYASTAYE